MIIAFSIHIVYSLLSAINSRFCRAKGLDIKTMDQIIFRFVRIFFAGCLLLVVAAPAWATQTHSEPEGLYVHQMAHLFFALAMVILIYWLRARDLTRVKGWRFIQYAALLFILWNTDAFLVHYLDEQAAEVLAWRWVGIFYFVAKLDHLICVPAMVLLYIGLRKLHGDHDPDPGTEGGE